LTNYHISVISVQFTACIAYTSCSFVSSYAEP